MAEVRVKQSRLVVGPSGTGWTCNNVIRFKRARRAEDFPQQSTFIHELAHVWQHQSGQAQLIKGFVEQVSKLFGANPYDFGGPAAVRQAARITDFPKESQAEIVRSYWMSQNGFRSDIKGVSFSTPGFVDDLRRLVEGAGIGGTVVRPLVRMGSVVAAIDSAVARVVNAILG